VNMTEKFYARRQDIYDCFTVQVGHAAWGGCNQRLWKCSTNAFIIAAVVLSIVQQQCLKHCSSSASNSAVAKEASFTCALAGRTVG
jgi:hypothetical protein